MWLKKCILIEIKWKSSARFVQKDYVYKYHEGEGGVEVIIISNKKIIFYGEFFNFKSYHFRIVNVYI